MQWESYQLKNGVQIFASKNGDAQQACLGFYFARGSASEEKRGLCSLWAEMLQEKLNKISGGSAWKSWPDWDDTTFTINTSSPEAASVFFRCLVSPDWTEEDLAQAKKLAASPKGSKKGRSFSEQMAGEYWRGSVYAVPVQASAQELEAISLKQITKWHQALVESGFACVLTGRITADQLRTLQTQAAALKECKSEKKKKKVLPKEFGCRNLQSVWITDLESGPAQAMISFDIPSKKGILPALAFCLLLDAGEGAPVSWLLKDNFSEIQGIRCHLEQHEAASRLVLSFSLPSEELVGALRKCFLAFSYLKQGLKTEEAAELLEFWAQERRKFWKDSQKVNLHMGRYYCIAEEECRAFVNHASTLSAEGLREAAGSIFQPENMTVAIACQPGLVKRKKLQKVLLEARVLLQGPEAHPEESAEVRKKILRQFIRDCQAETDAILSGETSRSAHQLWRKFQCYIRLRKAGDSHYSFDGVQEFLLGHGYSKEDVKRLKKRKDREKSENKGKKADSQEDWQRIEDWFFQDTVELIRALETGEPWQGAPAAAVKRSNLCMRYRGRTERGLDAVKAMLDGKTADLTRIQSYLETKKAGKNDAETHTDDTLGRTGDK